MRKLLIPLAVCILAGAGAAAALLARDKDAREEYRIGCYGGLIAVYVPGEGSLPREVTSQPVELLPGADILQLREGISVRSREELAMLLEDLGS